MREAKLNKRTIAAVIGINQDIVAKVKTSLKDGEYVYHSPIMLEPIEDTPRQLFFSMLGVISRQSEHLKQTKGMTQSFTKEDLQDD